MMEALRAHFPTPGEGAVGSLDWPSDLRRKLAKESLDFVCPPGKVPNREVLPELTPEEMAEDKPELPPVVVAAAAEVAKAVTEEAAATPPGAVVDEALVAPDADALGNVGAVASTTEESLGDDIVGTDGLRQRRGHGCGDQANAHAAAQPSERTAGGAAPSAAPAAPQQDGAAAAPRRRAREDDGGPRHVRRPQQPILYQLLRLHTRSNREWVLVVVDVLILLLAISFVFVLMDLLRNPPQILNPLTEARDTLKR